MPEFHKFRVKAMPKKILEQGLHIFFVFFSIFSALDVGHEDAFLHNDVIDDQHENQQNHSPRVRRRRTKSGGKSYDFRDYGVDARRRGAKHQRRKQNCK